jgi:hypothetical protein
MAAKNVIRVCSGRRMNDTDCKDPYSIHLLDLLKNNNFTALTDDDTFTRKLDVDRTKACEIKDSMKPLECKAPIP